MKNSIVTAILLIAWTGLFSQQFRKAIFDQANSANKSVHPEDFHEQLISWSEDAHIPGMSVCILKNGDLHWKLHHGLADIEENKPVTDSSCFILCSISKPIVETAIMQLYEQGHFELDDNINDTLPNPIFNPTYPDDPITYFQLMTHTSSIQYCNSIISPYINWGGDPLIALGDFLEGLLIEEGVYYEPAVWHSNHAPGTFFDYSNIGNNVLGYLAQIISGQDFEAYCQDFVFAPLGINNASFFLSSMDTSHLVTQYRYLGGLYTPWDHPGAPYYTSGSLKMSAVDLSKFLGMYMKQGSYNNNTILDPETVELITTPNEGSLYQAYSWGQMCLNWIYLEDLDLTYHGGGWSPFASAGMGYDKDDQWGIVFLVSTRLDDTQYFELQELLVQYAQQYEPFSITGIDFSDSDGDRVIEANEQILFNLKFRNNINFTNVCESITATLSTNNTNISFSDSTVYVGDIAYLNEVTLSSGEFIFNVGNNVEAGNVEFNLHLTWEGGNESTIRFDLYVGHADVLLVKDEESTYPNDIYTKSEDWYLRSLDSLNYKTNFYDLELRGDPMSIFIKSFPTVIWYTGRDSMNTLSSLNQTHLIHYLNNGGNLFLSGQNISEELAGTDFLKDYLFAEHIQDTWSQTEEIAGTAGDPIGNGQVYQLNQGDGLANQYSMSVIEPMEGAYSSFGYMYTLEGAAVRYENDTYKSIFFGFGFEAIDDFDNRKDLLFRILNDYFGLIMGKEEQLISTSPEYSMTVFPNPCSGSANLRYTIQDRGYAICDLYSISGIKIKELMNEEIMPGTHEMELDLRELPAGIYYCVLKTLNGTYAKKLIKL